MILLLHVTHYYYFIFINYPPVSKAHCGCTSLHEYVITVLCRLLLSRHLPTRSNLIFEDFQIYLFPYKKNSRQEIPIQTINSKNSPLLCLFLDHTFELEYIKMNCSVNSLRYPCQHLKPLPLSILLTPTFQTTFKHLRILLVDL